VGGERLEAVGGVGLKGVSTAAGEDDGDGNLNKIK